MLNVHDVWRGFLEGHLALSVNNFLFAVWVLWLKIPAWLERGGDEHDLPMIEHFKVSESSVFHENVMA